MNLTDTYYCNEIAIDIVGNVDSGKSTLCGILSNPSLMRVLKPDDKIMEQKLKICDISKSNKEQKSSLDLLLDDGNGSARKRVLSLKHEQESGRTSSISYNYMIFDEKEEKTIVSLVDLAGHDTFLKTTITGIMSSYPEYGFVLVAKNITHMTREHYSILASMGIPILFVLTKIDIIPEKAMKENINKIRILSKKYGKSIQEIKSDNDIKNYVDDNKVFGYLKISNKTGEGIPLLINYIRNIKNSKNKKLIKGFSIDRIYYNIPGFGLVISGITGIEIKKGDSMVVGPFKGNKFYPVKIRSIHNDYKQFVDVLKSGVRGCLCIRIEDNHKEYLRNGMVVCYSINDVNSVKNFKTLVAIFCGKSTSIKSGFNSYINIGMVRCGIKFNTLRDPKTNEIIKSMIPSSRTIIDMEFMTHHNCINLGDVFLFRSGRTQGIGKVISL